MAVFRSDYDNYMIQVGDNICHFDKGRFETDDEELIAGLMEADKFNISFYRIDDYEGKDETTEEMQNWKDRRKPTDNMKKWSPKTIKAFKSGEKVFRCPNECGYASYRKPMLENHLENCPKKEPDE